jgi:Zn-dependent M28 family amino/carboxypeptidase
MAMIAKNAGRLHPEGPGPGCAAYLRRVVEKLAVEIGPRPYFEHARLEEAADFIAGELASRGLGVTEQRYDFGGRTYRNVVGELVGERGDEPLFVVGAHYDTVRGTPGADDNASGVAGLLALAGELAGRPAARTVRFAAFAHEEYPVYRTKRMASYRYARSLREAGVRVAGMICLEMIGFFSDREGSQSYPLPFMSSLFPKAGDYIAMVGNRKSTAFTRRAAEGFQAATDLPLRTLNAPAVVIGIDFSDHWSFGKFGHPALMVTDTAFYRNPNYHGPGDLPDTLDFVRMAQVVAGLRGSVERLSTA